MLFFPCAQTSNYQRCLLVAQHLKPWFDIRFLFTDQHASLVYQNGFDTFLGNFFTVYRPETGVKSLISYECNLELAFLEQVEILETHQPAFVIGDGSNTLSMAAEFTGVPFISLMNGYYSPFYANKPAYSGELRTHEPYRLIREKYGLRMKHSILEELEGELNWICDLPELFPQKELPFHFELLGPLFEMVTKPVVPDCDKLNLLKRTILISLDNPELVNGLEILNSATFHRYNLVADASVKNLLLKEQIQRLNFVNTKHIFPNADLIVCDTDICLYKALHYGIPVIFTPQVYYQRSIIEALEHWNIGTSWSKTASSPDNKTLDCLIHKKHSDAHRMIQYKIKEASAVLGKKLIQSIALHFPSFEKSSIAMQK